MIRKILSVNPENNAGMGIEKILELRYQINQTVTYIRDNKDKLEAEKDNIFEKLNNILLTKEKLMTYLQKVELDIEIKRRPPAQSGQDTANERPFEFEKKVFYQKLEVILKKLEYDILIIKFKKLGNNLKVFCFVWDTLFTVYVYIEKSKPQFYRIFDIVITNIQDKGMDEKKILSKSIDYVIFNDLKEVKELDPQYKNRLDAKLQTLKKLFDLHFKELVFDPSTVFFKKITLFIRKVFFQQKPQSAIEFEYLVIWYLNGYKLLFNNEETKCELCGDRMIFDSAKTGFLACTVYKNNKFYHDKCFIQK